MADLFASLALLVGAGKTYFNSTENVLGDLVINTTYDIVIKYSNTITKQPIERSGSDTAGSYASDHVYNNPVTVSMRCAMLGSPVTILSTATGVIDLFSGNIIDNITQSYKGNNKLQLSAFQILTDMRNQGTICTLVDKLTVIDNLVIVDLEFPRNKITGDSLEFNLKLEQLEFKESRTITALNSRADVKDTVSGKTDLGNQVTEQLTPVQESRYKDQLTRSFDHISSLF